MNTDPPHIPYYNINWIPLPVMKYTQEEINELLIPSDCIMEIYWRMAFIHFSNWALGMVRVHADLFEHVEPIECDGYYRMTRYKMPYFVSPISIHDTIINFRIGKFIIGTKRHR